MPVIRVYYFSVILIYVFAVISFILLAFVTAPYGRHIKQGWGLQLPNKLAWVVMESPAVLVFLIIFLMGTNRANPVELLLCAMWQFHYIYRTFIFPFRLRTSTKLMPVIIVLFGFIFNCANAFINSYYLAFLGHYTTAWLIQPRFWVGVLLFVCGYYIHFRSDNILIQLRKKNETEYKIPTRFLFHWICSPNYLGEMIQWLGFAVSAWSLPAFTFFIYTVANLTPRALQNLHWYREHFSDYPANKKALIPFLI